MAFRQHHRPQPSRQLSFHEPPAEVDTVPSPQRKRPLEESEEWVLFSPVAPSDTARTHTTSTERTPRTAGLSRVSDFGSLDTAARSDQQDDDDITCQGTEEELDSLDDGLHAFHEPSEYGAPASRLQQSGDTVLPTHDGLGTFQPDGNMQDHLWQFERQPTRRQRPHARRRSSVQRRLDALEEAEEIHQEQDRRQRIEKWRLEQSKALLEEIERETRRRRRMSMVSAARSRADSAQEEQSTSSAPQVARSVSDGASVASDESTEQLSFWQRLTRRVIRDLMGIDDNTLSVIFGEALPEEAMEIPAEEPASKATISSELQSLDVSSFPGEPWEHRLLERVARELGILISQLSEHPGAFSTYRNLEEIPEYAGLDISRSNPSLLADLSPIATTQASTQSPSAALFAPSLPSQQANVYSEASLWGIEEEPEIDPLDSFRNPQPATTMNIAEDLAREREYWERELDVKMVFNFLLKRFSSSRRSSITSQPRRSSSAPAGEQGPTSTSGSNGEGVSARRAAIIRQHHPLVSRNAERALPSSSVNRESRRKEVLYRQHLTHQASLRSQVRSSSSCASQSTKKSKRSNNSARNYWDLGGSVGSGSVLAGEA
ncbi:hypothetical protein BDV96DRAFT_599747 [Lophiotrema nucula]|uniref:Uncharacterized protein n=1 Tax=Lophiotrema nucula TaxID=690887 RepID=A0A6A5Z7L6_9PLEO|nr:hypothetical protein BDV96DRAFT_599747 [Lophiotrema nucula]